MTNYAPSASPSNSTLPPTRRITDDDVRRVADELGVDERSVVRRLAGLPVRGRCGQRIDAALAAISAAETVAQPSQPSRPPEAA